MSVLDVVITTYNRPLKVLELVGQLKNLVLPGEYVIVVDSSDNENIGLKNLDFVHYVRASHKNQPYQRYLGYLTSEADWIVFLDDDMEVIDPDAIKKLKKLFNEKSLSAVAIKFINKHQDTLLSKIPISRLFGSNKLIRKIKGFLTGYPELKPGKFSFCGNRGHQPVGGGNTEWVSGGAFAAKHQELFQDFNFQLFELFEEGFGMGEDGIIGYGLSKRGKIYYFDELLFVHNDQKDSTYSLNVFNFAKRIAYSRLFLSLEKSRLDRKNLLWAKIHYHYYLFWRIIGLFLNYMICRNEVRLHILMGTLEGWRHSLSFKFHRNNEYFDYWKSESIQDLSNK